MPLLIAIAAILGGLAFWYYRGLSAGRRASDLLDAAGDVVAAARRFNFNRRANVHPADSVDDPRLAAAGVIVAVAEMAGAMTQEQLRALDTACRTTFRISADEGRDMVAFGRWIAGQCGTPDEAARRLTRVVERLAGPAAGPDLLSMCSAVVGAGGAPTDRQQEALQRIARSLAAPA